MRTHNQWQYVTAFGSRISSTPQRNKILRRGRRFTLDPKWRVTRPEIREGNSEETLMWTVLNLLNLLNKNQVGWCNNTADIEGLLCDAVIILGICLLKPLKPGVGCWNLAF